VINYLDNCPTIHYIGFMLVPLAARLGGAVTRTIRGNHAVEQE